MPSEARPLPDAIVVVGDGQVGLAAAIALRRALPRTEVTLVPCPPDPSAMADRAVTSVPRSSAFHERIGLDESGFVMRAGASHRLGVRFLNWSRQAESYVHAYGVSAANTHSLSVGQTLAEAELFANPSNDPTSPLSDIDHALRFNPSAYKRRLTALADHLGVRHLETAMTGAFSDGAGGLSHIKLADGSDLSASLFVDCTGSWALLADATQNANFESWSEMLPCNRISFESTDDTPPLLVTDTVEAMPWGWRSTIFGRDGAHHAFAYHSDIGIKTDIAEQGEIVAFEAGRLKNSWIGNVVAFGDSAAVFEPLHWVNLALAHEQILLFLELLPGREIDATERAEFNRRAGAMADRVRDFIGLHYCTPSPPEGAFWRHAANLQRSAGLSLTLWEFARRGRLPFFEEETLSRDAWQSAMACIGVPAGASAPMLALSTADTNARSEKQQMRSAQALEMAEPYPAWLKNYVESNR